MKRTIVLLVALIVSGCDHKSDDRDGKIAKLEVRLSELEAHQQELRANVTNLFVIIEHIDTESIKSFTELKELGLKQRATWDALQPLLEVLQTTVTNPPVQQANVPRSVVGQPKALAKPNPSATRDGVPIAVYNQIAADAEKKWPGNYEMQAFTIKNQTEAYRNLHP